MDYIEKMYASGKIPGGFFKREAKPTTDATLNARLIDRAIRPLFPDGFRNPIHVVINVLSYDGENDPAMAGMLGASLSLSISDIPFNGPIAGVTVGYINDELVVNPTVPDLKTQSKLNLSVAGSDVSICMIESAATELPEHVMLDAVFTGHEEIKKLVAMQKDFIAETGKEKFAPELDLIPEEIMSRVEADFVGKVAAAAIIKGKQERQDAFDAAEAEMIEKYTQDSENHIQKTYVSMPMLFTSSFAVSSGIRFSINKCGQMAEIWMNCVISHAKSIFSQSCMDRLCLPVVRPNPWALLPSAVVVMSK